MCEHLGKPLSAIAGKRVTLMENLLINRGINRDHPLLNKNSRLELFDA